MKGNRDSEGDWDGEGDGDEEEDVECGGRYREGETEIAERIEKER
jgi:hypothetical protein